MIYEDCGFSSILSRKMFDSNLNCKKVKFSLKNLSFCVLVPYEEKNVRENLNEKLYSVEKSSFMMVVDRNMVCLIYLSYLTLYDVFQCWCLFGHTSFTLPRC